MMMSEKRFIIDVEEEFQENAVFFGDEFLCFEDDSESLVSKLNEQQATINKLREENKKLKEINKDKEQDVLHLYKKNEKLREIIKKGVNNE